MLDALLDSRYKLDRILGSGGFGQTFVAEDTRAEGNPLCVVKQLKPLSTDPSILEVGRRLFFSEVEMLRKLGVHDRIPALQHDFEENDQFYLVQEYIEGRSLSQELALFQRLDESQVVDLLRDVLEILEFVHANNVIHRDIKPSNLIRRQADGRIVLIDFGAVKELNTQLVQESGQTKLTVGIATQGYGPTEQLAGKPRYNSDIYALGMTAIQALTGLHPSQLPTHPDTGEVIWRDRATVSSRLAAILDKMVRYHFNQRFQSTTDVLAALDQTVLTETLEDLDPNRWADETQVPTTPWPEDITRTRSGNIHAPNIYGPTIAQKPVNQKLLAVLTVGIASLIGTGLVVATRTLNWLQPLEIAAYDRMVQALPEPAPDPRLLVVAITETDIQEQKRFPLSDQTVAQVLAKLQQSKPKVIGLDLFRDVPQEPGRTELLTQLKAPNLMAITKLGTPITPAPPEVSPDRVGFNDVPLDPDNVVRRNLMFADIENQPTFYSLALRLATFYLASEGIRLKPSTQEKGIARLGKADFFLLEKDSGGYEDIDDRGSQILLTYRGRNIAQQVSLGAVLKGQVKPAQIRDKIVLIGTTAENAKDLFLTPYSPIEKENPSMPGVLIHAQMVSQFLNAATHGQSTFWFVPTWVEILWIGVWSILSGTIAWFMGRYTLFSLLGEPLLAISVILTSFAIFTQMGWLPVIAPLLGILFTSTLVIAYRLTTSTRYNRQRQNW